MTTLWLNGDLLDATEARIDPTDRGFLLGAGLFETILVREGKPVFVREHLTRLREGAARLNIALALDNQALTHAIEAVLAANDLVKSDRASLRITLTEGPGPRGLVAPAPLSPTLLISAAPGQTPALAIKAHTTDIRRNEMSGIADLKTLPYLDQVRARREASQEGADVALFLNTKGKLCCATAANIFLWDSNTLLTPPVPDGCLNGITRLKIIEAARAVGLSVFEESITLSTLANVESAFVTNSLVGVQEISALDLRPLKSHAQIDLIRKTLDEAERKSLSAL
ncbi:MAG: aminotransferase class IV [Parvibaculum sp.]